MVLPRLLELLSPMSMPLQGAAAMSALTAALLAAFNSRINLPFLVGLLLQHWPSAWSQRSSSTASRLVLECKRRVPPNA
jgi:hypothetical protein